MTYTHLPTFGRYESESLIEDVFSIISQSHNQDRTLVFPTYFLEEGPVERSRTSSGVLSQFVLDSKTGFRSGSVLHSHFAVGDNAERVLSASEGSFTQGSDFHLMLEMNATILMLGCNFERGATLLHQVEADLAVPYRGWINLQKSVSLEYGKTQEIEVPYFSRKRGDLKENFQRVQSDFMTAQKLSPIPMGYGYSSVVNANALYEFAAKRVRKDPFYLVREVA